MSQCAICFSTSKTPFTTKCDHTFCNKCLLQWMLENDSCPMCRYSISEKDLNANPDLEIDDEIDDDDIPIFTVYMGRLFNNKYKQILNDCVDDFIDAYRNDESYFPKFNWKETKEGFYDVRVKQNRTYITFRFEIFRSVTNQNRYIINVFTKTMYIKKFNDIKQLPFPKNINYKSNPKLYRRCP